MGIVIPLFIFFFATKTTPIVLPFRRPELLKPTGASYNERVTQVAAGKERAKLGRGSLCNPSRVREELLRPFLRRPRGLTFVNKLSN